MIFFPGTASASRRPKAHPRHRRGRVRGLAHGILSDEAPVGQVERLTLLDIAEPRPELLADERVDALVGSIGEQVANFGPLDLVFHFAGVVSGAAKADLDLGMQADVDDAHPLLDYLRAATEAGAKPATFAFTNSPAVSGDHAFLGQLPS